MAGVIPTDPYDKTFRELCWMHGGALAERWARQSHAMALLANCHRDPKKRKQPFEPMDFNAWEQGKAPTKEPTAKASKADGTWGDFKQACSQFGWISGQ